MSKDSGGNPMPLIVATAFAVLGVGAALWMVVPRVLPADTGPTAAERPPTEAESALAETELDTTTADAPETAVDAAVRKLGSLLVEAQNVPRPDDLAAAFRERLIATVDPRYERDLRAKIARGMEPPAEPWPEGGGEHWQAATEYRRGAGISVAEMEARWARRGGRRVAPDAGEEGYGLSSATANHFDTVLGPVLDSASVFEVRLPVSLKPIRGEAAGPVLVGFEFVWHPGRNQWVPHRNNVYGGGDAIYLGLIL